jgi:DNA-binding HxlR family transcriptional regulator
MQWLDYESSACSVQRTLCVIGEKWTILLIRDAANGVHRFDDFRRHVGLSEAVLADRLRTLVREGLFETREYREQGQRRRREYRLTKKGWDLFPVLVALMQWGDKHLDNGTGEPLRVVHKTCGHEVEAVVRCTHDHRVVTQYDTRVEPGPGARPRAS